MNGMYAQFGEASGQTPFRGGLETQTNEAAHNFSVFMDEFTFDDPASRPFVPETTNTLFPEIGAVENTGQQFHQSFQRCGSCNNSPQVPPQPWKTTPPSDDFADRASNDDAHLQIEELKTLIQECLKRLDENARRIDLLRGDFAAYQPFFKAMRTTMKTITRYVNSQWEVQTPIAAPRKSWMGSTAPAGEL